MISCRDPDTLCADLEPEFNTMLTYIQTCSSKKRPDYKYIKKQLLAIKERNGFNGVLEWYQPKLDAKSASVKEGGAHIGTEDLDRQLTFPKNTNMQPIKKQHSSFSNTHGISTGMDTSSLPHLRSSSKSKKNT